ncbi:molybdopterin-dependent oxidoreductase [Antrihabitans cavernicola]|uniref:Molybdopterin-dependent oxidoreductase n=1 Tax=Antrihabitans cavernicola TaxID=2495913 RepID=A0A5A7SBJ2_9NOCA|nr:molybdopterin-dependent oxidoreductase [Spelaeibacter cavernicola]KAA0022522.1 molybdopterin-dependent oxidoreductase [Spelaeibacter cavernicola]
MPRRPLRALAGIVSACATLGVAELVAAPIGANSSPMLALGSVIVNNTPDGFREQIIKAFGTNDKTVLFVVMAAVAIAVAAIAGIVERTNRPRGSALFGVFALLAAAAAVTRAGATWAYAIPIVLGVIVGIVVLRWLTRALESEASIANDQGARREFLGMVVGAGVLAVVTTGIGRFFASRAHNVDANRAVQVLPTPTSPAPPIPPEADLKVPGAVSYITPNGDFYRIDTALVVPQLSTDEWSLRIHGMVDREVRITFADLAKRQAVERVVTLTCVSNPIGGDLIGNAKWLGYPIKDFLDEAGVHPDADMVMSKSTDNFTAGTPIEVLTDGRDAILAIGMNGEPLPVEHGYPARLVVPGLYGYVSATKWVTDIEVTRFDKATAYWTKRGWSERGPIKTGTRIDTPVSSAQVSTGKVPIAGVAWAQHTGIKAVEVQIDNGNWVQARLSQEYSTDTWRQWAYDWDATPGPHLVRARSTDNTGKVQTADLADVVPDGATGYPEISLRVS